MMKGWGKGAVTVKTSDTFDYGASGSLSAWARNAAKEAFFNREVSRRVRFHRRPDRDGGQQSRPRCKRRRDSEGNRTKPREPDDEGTAGTALRQHRTRERRSSPAAGFEPRISLLPALATWSGMLGGPFIRNRTEATWLQTCHCVVKNDRTFLKES